MCGVQLALLDVEHHSQGRMKVTRSPKVVRPMEQAKLCMRSSHTACQNSAKRCYALDTHSVVPQTNPIASQSLLHNSGGLPQMIIPEQCAQM